MYSLIYWHSTCGVARYNNIHWHKIFIARLFQMIFIIHSTIIHDKIIWCKWAHDLVYFTMQNISNYTIIWLKSFCLLKSTTWTLPINPNIIPFISEANFSPPSSRSHWLLFVKPMKQGAQGGRDGMQKGEESSTKWG